MTVRMYEETSISTQDRGRVVVMLYEGAIRFLRQAIRALEQGDHVGKGRAIGKAQDIIMELNNVLDMETGRDIAANLRQLYMFMWKHLNQANLTKDPRMVQRVIELLEELNRGWRTIAS
ncbi:MAG: flagellar export chaperone FliS [Phycisphaerae bacterium]|nr:flagellar export chaperone FliS [Phycisphaerae bacterium]